VPDSICAVYDRLPPGFLDCPADRLANLLKGPTLFELKGRDPRPLFISVLLHGNEDSGLLAAQEALRRHQGRELRRSLLLFIGNVRAAAQNLRMLDDQVDFNRIWPGGLLSHRPEAKMAQFVFETVAARDPFAAIDIHNNTGFNPHYGCIAKLEPKFIALAQLFSRIVVHFERPLGTCAAAFAQLCPAVTVECGKAGLVNGAEHAAQLIEAALSISELPDHPPAPQDVDLLRTYAIVKPPAGASFSFDGAPADFEFRPDIDRLNFSELAAGESFGSARAAARLEIAPGDGDETHPGEYFDYGGGAIRLAHSAIPAMLTLDPRAVRLDCLCYLMHRIGLDGKRL
jgi:succinylglutamate desuccinylase